MTDCAESAWKQDAPSLVMMIASADSWFLNYLLMIHTAVPGIGLCHGPFISTKSLTTVTRK